LAEQAKAEAAAAAAEEEEEEEEEATDKQSSSQSFNEFSRLSCGGRRPEAVIESLNILEPEVLLSLCIIRGTWVNFS
jgi:hypothetical protein